MNVVLLANPAARSGARTGAARRAAQRLRERGVRTTVLSGGSAGETTELLRAALDSGVDAVVVAGGDGTVHLAIQELAGGSVPLGIVPSGTGNDLALALGLRELDPEAAADAVADGRTRRIDLARLQRADGSTRFYATVLASGFDSRVNDRANAMRWPRGRTRYTLAILREFIDLAGIPFAVEMQDERGSTIRRDGPLVLAAIGNARSYGGGIPMCPVADPGDGLLDVTVVRPAGRLHLLRLLPRAYRGTHTSVPEVETYRVRSVHLHAEGVTAYADGEPMGALPMSVSVAADALDVFVPVR